MGKETLFTITSILLNNSDNEISSCDSSNESENEDDINLPFKIGNIIHIINCKQNARRDYVCLKIDRLCKTCHSGIFENNFRRTFSVFKVSEMFIRQLLQLKGMSVDKATVIVEQYPTPRILIDALQRSDCNEELLLSSIQFGDKKRQLGVAISKTIYQLYTKKTFN